MKLKKTIVVPTYWGRTEEQGNFPGDLVFDHPTPLDGTDTLSKMLHSLAVLDSDDYRLVIVVAPTSDDIADQAVARVREIVDSVNPSVKAELFSHNSIQRIQKEFGPDYDKLLSLRGYAHVRNSCLIAAHLSGADVAVLIDDDESFQLPDFLHKVEEGLSQKIDGEKAKCLVGYYVNSDGDYLINNEPTYWDAQWPKDKVMNDAFREFIGEAPRYKKTPFGFGGNLSIGRELFSLLPFDTKVTRGEDIDYLMMARMHGISPLLDNQLSILHEPPIKSHPAWMQLRQDYLRFVYEKSKLKAAQKDNYEGIEAIDPDELDPYPGFFLKDDLEQRIEQTCARMAKYYLGILDMRSAQQAMANQELARRAGKGMTLAEYVELRSSWQELMKNLQTAKLADVME